MSNGPDFKMHVHAALKPVIASLLSIHKSPRCYKTAMKSADSVKWKEACDAEYSVIISNQT